LHPAQVGGLPIDRPAVDRIADQNMSVRVKPVAVQDREVSRAGGERGDELLDHLF
jgi:hypothetical protein